MHIAICDDNIADRKQTERLLGREATKRINTYGSLYVDSFGNDEALCAAPMIYDLFFIDVTSNPPHGMELAIKLRKMGVTAPICLCRSEIAYEKYVVRPDCLMFLDKPILVSKLEEVIDKAIEIKKNLEPTVELRDGNNTYYIGADKIMYCSEMTHEVEIRLVDNSLVYQIGNITDMCVILQKYDNYALIRKKYIINIDHIKEISGHKIIMNDESTIIISLIESRRLKEYINGRRKQLDDKLE